MTIQRRKRRNQETSTTEEELSRKISPSKTTNYHPVTQIDSSLKFNGKHKIKIKFSSILKEDFKNYTIEKKKGQELRKCNH